MTAVAVVLLLAISQIALDKIEDPLADFVRLNPQINLSEVEIEDVQRVYADINADGVREIFLRNTALKGDRGGVPWKVYVQQGDTYARLSFSAIFRPDAFYVGPMEGVDDTRLFSYVPSGASEGSLSGIKLKGDKLVEELIKMIYPSEAAVSSPDYEFYVKTFTHYRDYLEMIPREVVDRIKAEIAAEKAEEEAALIGEPVSATTLAKNTETQDQPPAAEEVQDAEPLPVSPLAAEDAEPVIEKQAPTETATQESPEGNFTIYLITALGLIIVVGIVAFVRR